MTAKVVCFASAKGGTGKTVISASFSQFISALGKKVLLIDTDASTNGLTLFYLHEIIKLRKDMPYQKTKPVGLFEADYEKLPTPFNLNGQLDMIPATYVMEQTADCEVEKFRDTIQHTLRKYRDCYDYIFLDAQAGSDAYAEITIRASDEAVIVSEYDPVSFAGVDRLKTIFAEIMPYEKRWILYNKVLPEYAKKIGETRLEERYLPPIPWDAEVVRAFSQRRLALDTDKGSEHTIAIMRTVSSLLGEVAKKEIENWKIQKSEEIREPIITQKVELEKELGALNKVLIENEYELQDLKRRPIRRTIYFASIIAFILSYLYILFQLTSPRSSLSTPLNFIFVPTIVVTAFLTIAFEQFLERQTKTRAISRQIEISDLKIQIDELNESLTKKRALLDSDIDRVLENH